MPSNSDPVVPTTRSYLDRAMEIMERARHANERAAAAAHEGHQELAGHWTLIADSELENFRTLTLVADLSGAPLDDAEFPTFESTGMAAGKRGFDALLHDLGIS